MKLTSLYKDIILEAVSRNQIISAINNRNVCTIYYEGDTINNPGYREIEPYVYGLSKRENPVIRAYQLGGKSDTPENMPGWRLFRVDRMVDFVNSGDIFEEPKPLYNPNGDRDMTRIYTQAKF
jgi:predicted DNA-binding transcriptional regulator YafY|tara:strand:+ start:20 stop:388 length:369 start_codon:yes stop_codon:yes gene_type:complete